MSTSPLTEIGSAGKPPAMRWKDEECARRIKSVTMGVSLPFPMSFALSLPDRAASPWDENLEPSR
jgi:hypothetical protein